MNETLNQYKRSFFRAAEMGLVDYEKSNQEVGELASEVVTGKTKFDRVYAAFKLIKEFMPSVLEESGLVEDWLQNPEKLPFDIQKLKFRGKIGHGGENDVYLLRSTKPGQPSWALKINTHTGEDINHLTQIAAQIKDNYRTLRWKYRELSPESIPPEYHLVVNSPRRGAGAVATLQPFIGNEIRDFFDDIDFQQRLTLMQAHPSLAQDVATFTRVTNQEYVDPNGGSVIDLLGPKNLSVIKNHGVPQLILLDPHLIELDSTNQELISSYNHRIKALNETVSAYQEQCR